LGVFSGALMTRAIQNGLERSVVEEKPVPKPWRPIAVAVVTAQVRKYRK